MTNMEVSFFLLLATCMPQCMLFSLLATWKNHVVLEQVAIFTSGSFCMHLYAIWNLVLNHVVHHVVPELGAIFSLFEPGAPVCYLELGAKSCSAPCSA